MKKTCLISTVGTSLLFNLKTIKSEQYPNKTEEEIIVMYKDNQLNGRKPSAELASISSIIESNKLDETNELYLLSSDTVDGYRAATFIKEYFKETFNHVYVLRVPKLTVKDPQAFREEGLTYLTDIIVNIVNNVQDKNGQCIIDATGGFKAQVSFAGLIGQALNVPVYYLFEGFEEVVQLPNIPLSFDQETWAAFFKTFQRMNTTGSLPAYQVPDELKRNERLKDLFDCSDNQFRLSSTGKLFDQAAKRQHEKTFREALLTDTKNLIAFPDDVPLSLETVLQSMLQLSYVESITYVTRKSDFETEDNFTCKNEQQIDGSHFDGKDTWYFTIQTNANSMTETQNQMIDLNVRYARELKNPQPQDVEFLFIRHGQHVGDTDERIEGWADFELTKRGIEQSTLLANHLKEHKVKINHLYTSTLKRATVTANIVGEAIGLKPIPLNGLRAMNYGLPGGLKIFKSSIIFPKPKDLKAPHQKSWKSESEIDFSSRVLSTFYELYYSHPGETIAVVTHGRVISTIFRELMNLPFTHDFRVQSDDTSILHVKFSPKQTIIYSVNNTDHLKGASLLSDSDE